MYFDTHAHYDDGRFDGDRKDLLKKLPSLGIKGVINVGICPVSSQTSIDMAEKYDYFQAAVGVHPHNVAKLKENDLETIERLSERAVAIGEIGLDYYHNHSPHDVQKFYFSKQLELAKKLDMPVIIHSRDAAGDTLSIIKESGVKKGVLHCYSGKLPMALEYIEMGFYIGIGGVVTFEKAVKTVEVATKIPLEKLLLETDAPYLTPVPFRGKRNDSSKLSFVAEKIAALRNISKETVISATYNNALDLFSIANQASKP
ncbi:MAG: TatD family hydrolase [Turicibacter sp.]|nr:TatD family hydrolase [Turicibacter sp.]